MVAKGVTYRTSNPNESMDVDVHHDIATRQFVCVGSSTTGPCIYVTRDTDSMRVSDPSAHFF
jgi:hypothetical protein